MMAGSLLQRSVVVLGTLLLGACAAAPAAPDLSALSPVGSPRDVAEPEALACELIETFVAQPQDYVFIDARSPAEFAAAHIPGAVNIPYDQIADYAAALPESVAQPVVAYCRSGRRAELLRRALVELGYSSVEVVPGGQIETTGAEQRFVCGAAGQTTQESGFD